MGRLEKTSSASTAMADDGELHGDYTGYRWDRDCDRWMEGSMGSSEYTPTGWAEVAYGRSPEGEVDVFAARCIEHGEMVECQMGVAILHIGDEEAGVSTSRVEVMVLKPRR